MIPDIAELLEDWVRYKSVHGHRLTRFSTVIEIEIIRNQLERLAPLLYAAEVNPPSDDVIISFSGLLETFKDLLVLELLRCGFDSDI